MDEDYEDWMICIHSSGNEPGCVGCWHGSYQRANKENEDLRNMLREISNDSGILGSMWKTRIDTLLENLGRR